MPEIEYETSDTGVAVLAATGDGEDDPLKVRGVAIGEGDVTYGGSKTRIEWPREVLSESADALVGTKISDDSAHDVPDGGHTDGVPKQPPVDSIIGEVTDAHYEDGIGVVYEGEIDDPSVASLVENGRVEVSPFVFHRKGEFNDDVGAAQAEEIVHWRDLAVVSEGASPGASIEPAQSQVAAMSAEALTDELDSAFGTATDAAAMASFGHLDWSGTSTGKLDESAIPSDDYRSHYLFPADSKSESSFPVVDAEGNLRRGNVAAAWDLRGHAPGSKEDVEKKLISLSKKFDDPPIDPDSAEAMSAADGDEIESKSDERAESRTDTDGTADGDGSGTGDDSHTTPESGGDGTSTLDTDTDTESPAADDTSSNMELSEEEKDLVREARTFGDPSLIESEAMSFIEQREQYDDPEVVEADVASLGRDAAQHDDPEILPADEYESLSSSVETIKSFMAQALSEQTGIGEETASQLELDALMAEFEDEDGELDGEALVQSPETGDVGDEETDEESPTEVASLSDESRDEVRSLLGRAQTLESVNADYAESLRSEAADIVGVEEHTEIDTEAL